jgi:hypothetical protein
MSPVMAELARNKELRVRVENAREAIRLAPAEKTDLLMAYFDIILEHHHAVALLISHSLHGSAFALLRSTTDTLFRALWANGCATPAQINQILTDDAFVFPRDMQASIDKAYSTQSFFQTFKRSSWAAMCSYAHSGQLPITRRVGADGGVGPNYSAQEILGLLNATSGILVLAAIMFFRATGFEREAADMEALVMD